jgi:protocatechuate 3,4-dioxygenase beta subunit
MDDDDRPVGRILTRRDVLVALGAAGAMMVSRCSGSSAGSSSSGDSSSVAGSGSAPTACVVRPQQTEGPYFVDEMLNRSDVRSDPTTGLVKPGTPLELDLHVSRITADACTPLPGAVVDIWSCDHEGVYSGVVDPGFDSRGQRWLRGLQTTDENGVATFTTLYPGWYPGRTVHIHFKIRSAPDRRPGFEFTSQLYFDDAFTDQVHAREPYAARGARMVRNDQDGIFRRGGSQLMLAPTRDGEGYAATFEVSLQGV